MAFRAGLAASFALLLGAPWPVSATPVLLDERPEQPLGPALAVLPDPAGALSVEAALAAARAGSFRPAGGQGARLPGDVRVAWLHASVRGGPSGAWQLTWDQPLVDRLDVWLVEGGQALHRQGGLALPPAERTIRHAGPFHRVSLELPPGHEADLLVRVASSRPIAVEARAWTEAGLADHAAAQALLSGLESGALLLIVVLSLVSGLVRRDRWSVRLAAVLSAYLAYELSVTGQAARWLWPGAPHWSVSAPPFMAALTALLGLAFARAYVASREHHRRLDAAARLVAGLDLLCAAGALLAPVAGAPGLAVYLGTAPAAVTLVVMVALGAAAVRRGDAPARWFLACCLVVAALGLPYAGAAAGLLPSGVAGGLAGLRAALLSAALLLFVGVIVRVEEERLRANAGLELAVAERTASLRETVDRLQVEVIERERAERGLHEADERFRVAFETSPDSINLNRLEDGVFIAINQGFTRLTGWTEAEVLGRSSVALQIWVDPADRARLVAGLQARGQVQNLEARFRFKDGRVVVGLMSARLVQLAGTACILSITRDISDMRNAEAERDALAEQLRQAQKLEAIGRLAGGVAHDFNNLLTAITTNTALALLDLPPGDPGRAVFEEVEEAAGRAAALTRQLLAFSRRQVIAPRPMDLAAQVAGMATMLRRVLGEDVALDFAPGGGAPAVQADPGQVEQVVLNLAVNARDAAGAGGHIRVATLAVEVPPGERGAERAPGRYGAIDVEDDGPGIGPDVLPHIFEPFFTTKHGRGTGLGLSTVYGIATQHGGFVEVASAPGRGTRFRVCFPAAQEAVRPAPAATAGPLQTGHETVLLAEDEPSVREVTRALLARLGYRVLPACDGEDALRVAAAHVGPIELLLTDVVMPGLNGRELARRLQAARPGLAVVYMSGYTQDVVDQAGVLEDGLTLVPKPFQPDQLAAAVRRALDAGAVVT